MGNPGRRERWIGGERNGVYFVERLRLHLKVRKSQVWSDLDRDCRRRSERTRLPKRFVRGSRGIQRGRGGGGKRGCPGWVGV